MNKQDLPAMLDAAFQSMLSWRRLQCNKHELAPDPDEYAEAEVNALSNTEFLKELIYALQDLN